MPALRPSGRNGDVAVLHPNGTPKSWDRFQVNTVAMREATYIYIYIHTHTYSCMYPLSSGSGLGLDTPDPGAPRIFHAHRCRAAIQAALTPKVLLTLCKKPVGVYPICLVLLALLNFSKLGQQWEPTLSDCEAKESA